ncbi:MAG: hypothetical protein MRY21_05035 [Simkaniaceae bacterium]|nr:hypothetical protein [Simkaniaceae bacterium]
MDAVNILNQSCVVTNQYKFESKHKSHKTVAFAVLSCLAVIVTLGIAATSNSLMNALRCRKVVVIEHRQALLKDFLNRKLPTDFGKRIDEYYSSTSSTSDDLFTALKVDSMVAQFFQMHANGQTIEAHSRDVVHLAETEMDGEFGDFGCITNNRIFYLFLALHDIGKGLALNVQRPREVSAKEWELRHNALITEKVLDATKLARPVKEVLLALHRDDTFGDLYKGSISTEQAVAKIREITPVNSIKVPEFFKLMRTFYKCDAGAYPFLRGHLFNRDFSFKTELISEASFQ